MATESLALARQHTGETETHADSLLAAFELRVRYDVNFISTRRDRAVAQVRAEATARSEELLRTLREVQERGAELYTCFDADAGTNSAPCAAFRNLHKIQERAMAAYEQSLGIHAEARKRVEEARALAAKFEAAYEDFADSLDGDGVGGWLLGPPPELDMDIIFRRMLENRLGTLPSADELRAELAAQEDDVRHRAEHATEQHRQAVETVLKAQSNSSASTADLVAAAMQELFEDYHPPDGADSAAVQGEIAALREGSDRFVEQLASAVGKAPPLPVVANATLPSRPAGDLWEATDTTPSETIKLLNPASWSVYMYEGFSLAQFFDDWASFSSLALYCDVVLRILHSLHIVRKTLNMSKVLTPPVDARQPSSRGTSSSPKSAGTPLQRAAHLAVHPATMAVVGAAFLAVLLSLAGTLYAPLFNRFSAGCVASDAAGPGTFLSQNAFTLAQAQAGQEGDRAAAAAVDRLNAERSHSCERSKSHYYSTFSAQLSRWEAARDRFALSRDDMLAVRECLRFEALPFTLSKSLQSSVCYEPVFEDAALGAVTTNCSEVEPCAFDCPRPHAGRLRFWSWLASCRFEGYVHGTVFGWVFAVLFYALLNASRVACVRGLRYTMWRRLHCGQFSYLAHFDPGGHEPGPHVQELAKLVDARMRGLERKGWTLIAGAVALLVPPFVLLRSVSALLSTMPRGT